MCEFGDTVDLYVWVPADLAYYSKRCLTKKPIDRCIAPIVDAMCAAGIDMRFSCCGHGERPGNILLQDGRVLVVHPDRASWERVS